MSDRFNDDGNVITKTVPKLKRPPMYTCVFRNDDYTPMDFVVNVLHTIFNLSIEEATVIMLAIHTQGRGNAGSYTYEVADHKCTQVIALARKNEFPLIVSPEPL